MHNKYIVLLQQLIQTPSFSREEAQTADILERFLQEQGVQTSRLGNNIWAANLHFDSSKPTLLLNSHHDTVKPNSGYTRDPFSPDIEDGVLYGLGSNDAGASAVSLLATFVHFYKRTDLTHNIIVAITAEEECSGANGIESLLPVLREKCQPTGIAFAIVGEPTLMDLAIAERGLMVLDCVTHGRAGHAAREEGENAIYKALKDIEWFRDYRFEKVSPLFGSIKTSVTIINAGTQHNVVPAECKFTVDVRVTEMYSHEELLEIIRSCVTSDVTPRSTRLRASSIDPLHPIVQAGIKQGRKTYGSPTSSDATLMKNIPVLKMGVGDSARSHSANEYVRIEEIKHGISQYISMIEEVIGTRNF